MARKEDQQRPKKKRRKLTAHPGSHLVDKYKTCGLPDDEKAIATLTRIASLVKPLMKNHSWTLPLLSEFFPDDPCLLGLNVNRGQEIRIRLRPARDETQFLEFESVLGTMIHELTHNIHSNHSPAFYKTMDELQTELEKLMDQGWKGDGFDSDGIRLGQGYSHNVSPEEARRIALDAAEKRAKIGKLMIPAGGRRLGAGSSGLAQLEKTLGPAAMAAMAAERRLKDNLWCGAEHPPTSGSNSDDSDNDSCGLNDESADQVKRKTPSAHWSCPVCTLDNPGESTTCDACLGPRPASYSCKPDPIVQAQSSSSQSIPPLKAPQSSSSLSKLANKPRETLAALLEVNKIGKRSQPWTCSKCTLLNDSNATKCEVCDEPVPSSTLTKTGGGDAVRVCSDGVVILADTEIWICPTCERETAVGFMMCGGCGFIRQT